MSEPPAPAPPRPAGAAILVQRGDRVVLRVSGRDPVRMLHGLITNDLVGAADDVAIYGAFLTPKGRMVAEARLRRHGGAVLVETAAAAEEPLRAHLRKYVPPLFARVEDDDAGFDVVGIYGPRAQELAAAVAAGPNVVEGVLPMSPLDVEDDAGADLLVPRAATAAVLERLRAAGAEPAGLEALEVLRIEAGRPRWGAELDDTVIPLEAGLKDRAISTTKGCYTGQEVIVRILHRGHVNRHLRGLLLGDVAAAAPGADVTPPREGRNPAPGAEVTQPREGRIPAPGVDVTVPGDARVVGRVTSACRSPRLGQTIALAYLRREVEPGVTVLVGPAPATVVELPFARSDAASRGGSSGSWRSGGRQ